jgi:hypothetical protein
MKQTPRTVDHSSILNADRGRRGSILVFLIIIMVIFTALGVGMVSLFGTSVLSAFAANSARRAGYLAESGLRYVVSEVRNPGAAGPEAKLNNIDDGSVSGIWFSTFPGISRYQVRVYPYWSKTAVGTGAATTTVTATVPNSGFPPGFAIPTAPGGAAVARLQVGPNNPVAITSVAGAVAGSKAVTYNLASAVIIPAGVAVFASLAFPTTNASQTITKGSTATPLVLNINAVTAIPAKNGAFTESTSGIFYAYQTARLVGTNVQLENITWTGGAATAVIPAGRYLVFSQAARLDVTGVQLQSQKVQTDYLAVYSATSTMPPSGPNQTPPALPATASGFSGNLDALDTSKSGDRVVVAGYIATGGTHAYWAAFQHLGEAGYHFEDPQESGRYIGFHVAPISDAISDNLRSSWMQYHTLNYDVQVKVGWDLNKPSGGSGITFRWHESPLFAGQTPPGNDPYRYYEGYGITYMIYVDDNHGSSDQIPNNIKPPGNSLNKKLLMVLWEQKVNASGVPTKDWLAYAILGNPAAYWDPTAQGERHPADQDQKVTGYQIWPDGRVNDNATIGVRVEDKFVTAGGVTTRYNDIKVFYGDASDRTFSHDSRTMDAVATNKQRARYYPQWLEISNPGQTLPVINPQWPSNKFGLSGSSLAYWFGNQTSYDYFSVASASPTAPFNTVTWVINNSPASGFSAANLLSDNSTIRTTDFALDSFPAGRKEIGLVGMGDISNPSLTLAFDDFYIQILGGY